MADTEDETAPDTEVRGLSDMADNEDEMAPGVRRLLALADYGDVIAPTAEEPTTEAPEEEDEDVGQTS